MTAATTLRGTASDMALVVLVFAILAVLFIPIPGGLLDFLLLANFSFAFLLLLLTFHMRRPVDFSTFPSLLLIATLFRLSLNVAATRLILSEGDAGRVIGAIGAYVVGGNYVIGLVVFVILVVVQYVVVTNGAQRVSEVAARFTLDSMPGQQMSIDADLNMGFIDQAEAQRRRKLLEREASFHGAMDGASKFVKGDAIAGILILLVNIVGGLLVGVMQHGMAWGDALRSYTLLTIGDGIVTQVPALVIAVGTGIIVTRSAADGGLSGEVLRQLGAFPRTLVLVAVVLAALLLVPGIPAAPAIVLALALAAAAWFARRARVAEAGSATAALPAATTSAIAAASTAEGYAALRVEPIEVRVGRHWAALVEQPDSLFQERVQAFRRQHAQELGLLLPPVRFRDGPRLAPDRYEIAIEGVVVARGEARSNQWLAIHPAGDQRSIAGEATRDPTYGLPALWIAPAQRAAAQAAQFTLVDPASVLMTHLTEVLRRESAALLTRAETDRMLARVREAQPGLVEELIPTVLAVSDVQKVLQHLLREKVPVRNLEAILETLVDAGRATRDPLLLTEQVRRRLGHAICRGLMGEAGALSVLTLDPLVESRLLRELQGAQQAAQPYAVEPRLAEQFLSRLVQQAEQMMKNNLLPVLLCAPELRRHLRTLCERALPHLRVLSMAEVPQAIELQAFGVVSV